jgi:SET domain-containing protein
MIEVRASAIHGRGVFASAFIRAGTLFHVADLLIVGSDQHAALQNTVFCHYVFFVADDPAGGDADVTGLAMSPISFVNHRRPANASFRVDASSSTISFTAITDIPEGEEVAIDYGDFAEKLGIA